jgi:hypothetical protein
MIPVLSPQSIDTIIAVDTGGDSLYRTKNAETQSARTTPDQDLRVLEAVKNLNLPQVTKISTVIAAGVDSPSYANQILHSASAGYYKLSPSEKALVLATYQRWRLDGTDQNRYGKTPLAWQSALNGLRGQIVVPLPERVVLSETNPWIPFLNISESTEGIMIMSLDAHWKTISQ